MTRSDTTSQALPSDRALVPHARELKLVAGRSHPQLATEVAAALGLSLTDVTIRDFASGETLVRLEESVRGCDVFVLASFGAGVNAAVMETVLMLDALRRAAAASVTVVAPFFPYARQDKKGQGREPISARVVADMFACAGADRIMTVDLHTDQVQGFFNGPVDHLHALALLADHIGAKYDRGALTVVSPDAGRVKTAEKWADRLGVPLAILHKRRSTEVANQVKILELVGDVEGRTCVLVDDMIDTAGTIVQAAEALHERGAAKVVVASTHGVLSDPARVRLAAAPIDEVVLTDTLPVPPGCPSVTVLPIASMVADAIAAAFGGGSVTGMFVDGYTG